MIPFLTFDLTILMLSQSLIGMFIAIALIQSGIDKIFDRKGNIAWLEDHFKNSILRGTVPITLSIITFLELFGGGLCLCGAILYLLNYSSDYLILGFIISGINFMVLFFGQRVAKDYEGAAVLVGYFILTILGLLSFTK
ncbi:MAG: DoxX family protein [Candidatus Marinimicrobia bacterium]|jgi:hypothetical protein|nr:DoxX family protein [Candidatus Neomarinimicrobiota bacterium]MBT3617396.1 DoxX family protein [Candidatus Neomarinimicrobiota bacterium]MBT3829336.1 DoxX family protein [Candidatus Neomarinimicrobiota bacterium]MBT3998294.1 DoxX family protein [Candidatus Neomarinimicrobiota bacterium]MBT4281595.1 DoxX family protein [Candidatus Neomarinimicrobiota bacterium]